MAALVDSFGAAYPYSSVLGWTLTGPTGVVASRSLNYSDGSNFGSGSPVISLAAGSYTLTFAANDDETGTYTFRLIDLGTATPLAPRSPGSGTLSPGSDTRAYSFTGEAGDQIYVQH